MRCDEVIRELAVPDRRSGWDRAGRTPGRLPVVCRLGAAAALLDQLWDATRPPEPSPEAWDSVWANIAQALQSPAAEARTPGGHSQPVPQSGAAPKVLIHGPLPRTRPIRPRTRRFVAMALMGLAQAAAILIAWDWPGTSAVAGPDAREPRGGSAGYSGASSRTLGDPASVRP